MSLSAAGDVLHNPSLPYRPDIDGLRAIAIIMVVAFHYFGTRGGFSGVDVFFVISGYLISGIILSELAAGRFSLITFYARRIRRIFPSLVIVLVVTTAIGYALFFREDVRLLGKHLAGGALYVANFVLLGEAGYFDGSAETKPFLHLWSLAIEEQFYLFWPLLLLAMAKWQRAAPWLIPGTLILSFAANVLIMHDSREAAFYLPFSRFWELAAGGALAWITMQRPTLRRLPRPIANAASIIGIFLILLSAFGLRSSFAFPGWWALLPTGGAVLLIAAGSSGVVNRFVLASRPMVWIGLISYPLYLWHWPLIATARIHQFGPIPQSWKWPMLLISVALSYACYRWVELPMRGIPVANGKARRFVIGGIAVSLALAAAGAALWQGLIAGRLDGVEAVSMRYSPAHQYGCNLDGGFGQSVNTDRLAECAALRHPGAKTVVVIGDSHSHSLFQGIAPVLEQRGINAINLAVTYCTPLSLHDIRKACTEYNTEIERTIGRLRPDLVIIAANYIMWPSDRSYRETSDMAAFISDRAAQLVSTGAKSVLIIDQIPTWETSLPAVLNSRFIRQQRPLPERTFEGVVTTSLEFDAHMKSIPLVPQVSLFSLRDALCKASGCLTRLGDELPRELVVFDYGHLTEAGARHVMAVGLEKAILDALDRNPSRGEASPR